MPYHIDRWGGSMSNWANEIEVARNWAVQRPDYMMAAPAGLFFAGNSLQDKDYFRQSPEILCFGKRNTHSRHPVRRKLFQQPGNQN